MITDSQRDSQTTHAITNYLYAAFQGRYAFLNVLQQLNYPEFNQNLIGECAGALDQVATWKRLSAEGRDLFSASWSTPETAESQLALAMLDGLKPDLYGLAQEVTRTLAAGQWGSSPTETTLLLAAYARHAYSRENYIQGFIEFAERLKLPEALAQYHSMLPEATRELQLVQLLLTTFSQLGGQSPGKEFFYSLTQHTFRLPAIFRTHAHDINQLLAQYRGGLSFENADFSREETEEWRGGSFNPQSAGYWRAYGFSAREAVGWTELRIKEPAEAFLWKLNGLEAKRAQPWVAQSFPPGLAAEWERSGTLTEEAVIWREKGINRPSEIPPTPPKRSQK